MTNKVTVAAVQMDVAFADVDANTERVIDRLRQSADQGARLAIFPECALSGYCFESREEAMSVAQPIDGPATQAIANACRDADAFAVFGLLESAENRLYNALALVGPQGLLASYRKVHLPHLGVDNFVDRGDRPFQVHDLGLLRLGMQICYDGSFPEPSRVMSLAGADLLVLPTNWPPGAGLTADYVPNCRALENHVYFIAANRVGDERGFHFVGQSKIVEPNGGNLAFAEHDHEEILIADIVPETAREKHLVRVPGKHEIDRFADRQPGAYGPIVEPIE